MCDDTNAVIVNICHGRFRTPYERSTIRQHFLIVFECLHQDLLDAISIVVVVKPSETGKTQLKRLVAMCFTIVQLLSDRALGGKIFARDLIPVVNVIWSFGIG